MCYTLSYTDITVLALLICGPKKKYFVQATTIIIVLNLDYSPPPPPIFHTQISGLERLGVRLNLDLWVPDFLLSRLPSVGIKEPSL